MFDTLLLNAEPVRYIVIAEACLPFCIGFLVVQILKWSPGKDAGSKVRGRPPPFVFGLVWFLIAVLWLLALVVASMNFDVAHLVLVAIFLFLTFIECAMWLYFYTHGSKTIAQYILLLVILTSFMSLISAICSSTNSLDSNAPTFVGLCLGLPTVWSFIASMLGALELQITSA